MDSTVPVTIQATEDGVEVWVDDVAGGTSILIARVYEDRHRHGAIHRFDNRGALIVEHYEGADHRVNIGRLDA